MLRELINFASEYDPGFPQKILGATKEEIDRLASLAGRELPACYREFLMYMGKSMGSIGYSDVNFNIEAIARLHKNEDQELNWPQQFLVIAEHEQDPYFNYFLDLNTLREGDCRVVRFDIMLNADRFNPEHIHEEAPSFRTLLFEMTFLSKHLARLPHYASVVLSFPKLKASAPHPTEAIDVFDRAVLKMGFQKLPYSRPEHSMLVRQDAAIYGKGSRLGEVGVTMTAQDERELFRIREILSDYAALH